MAAVAASWLSDVDAVPIGAPRTSSQSRPTGASVVPSIAAPSLLARAASRLAAIRPMVPRVMQLDGEQLEVETSRILATQSDAIFSALEPLGSSVMRPVSVVKDEWKLMVQLAVYKLTVWDRGQYFGDRLMNLVYRDEAQTANGVQGLLVRTVTAHGGASVAVASTLAKRLLHLCLVVVVPYVLRKLQKAVSERQWDLRPDGTREKYLATIIDVSERTVRCLQAVNFIVFLWEGTYRSVADRLLRWRLVQDTQRMSRVVNMDFLNQQLFWTALFGFLSFVLPLLNMGKLWSRVSSNVRHLGHGGGDATTDGSAAATTASAQRNGPAEAIALAPCAQCGAAPVAQPRLAVPCQHVYCYYCVAERTVGGATFVCPHCSATVTGYTDGLPTRARTGPE